MRLTPSEKFCAWIIGTCQVMRSTFRFREREFSIGKLLVRIHMIIEMILVDRPCAMGV